MARAAKKYEYNGSELTLREISKITGVSGTLIYNRLARGWDIHKAVAEPVGNNGGGDTPSKGSVDKQHTANRKRKLTTFAQCAYRRN